MNPKCNLPEEREEEVLSHFPKILPYSIELEMKQLFPQYLFFRFEQPDDGWNVEKPERVCTCSLCGAEFVGTRPSWASGKIHNEPVTCPACGSALTGKAVSRFGYDMKSLRSWVKTAYAVSDESGALWIEAGYLERSFTWDTLTGTYTWQRAKRYYLSTDAVQMWELHREWPEDSRQWKRRKTITDPFAPNCMNFSDYHGEYQIIGLPGELLRSQFKYSQMENHYYYQYAADMDRNAPARWWVKYLAWYSVYPQIEMAEKLGLGDAVHELIADGRKNADILNWNATTPAGFLRMSKQDAKAFQKSGTSFESLKKWRDAKTKLSFSRWLQLTELAEGDRNLAEICTCAEMAGVGIETAVRYVTGLRAPCAQYRIPIGTIIRTWKDYLDAAKDLDLDLTVKSVVMPRDLQQRHDAATETVKINHELAEMKKYAARRRKLEKKYAFELGDYCIRVPVSGEEIVREGKTLHHCVGGYAARHIKGDTTILFLRHRRKPGRPFLTIEIREVRGRAEIVQIHGYKNERYDGARNQRESFAWFLNPWLEWIDSGSPRDRDGRPALPETETLQEVKTA